MSGMFEIKIDPREFIAIGKKLKQLGGPVANRIVKRAANYAMTPIPMAAKRKVPVKHGLLKKSIGKKSKFYKQNGVATCIVGPRTGYGEMINGKNHDPAMYGYVVEQGSKTAPAQPFLRPALYENKELILQRYKENALLNIEKEAKKLAAKK